jgi:hypothetical protein
MPPRQPTTLVLDALFGGVLMHVATTPAPHPDKAPQQMQDYADKMVEFVLAAVGVHEPTTRT